MDFYIILPWLFGLSCALLGGFIGWILRRPKILMLSAELDERGKNFDKIKLDHHAAKQKLENVQDRFQSLDSELLNWKNKNDTLEKNYSVMEALKDELKQIYNQYKNNTETQLFELQSKYQTVEAEKKTAQEKILKLEISCKERLNLYENQYNSLLDKLIQSHINFQQAATLPSEPIKEKNWQSITKKKAVAKKTAQVIKQDDVMDELENISSLFQKVSKEKKEDKKKKKKKES